MEMNLRSLTTTLIYCLGILNGRILFAANPTPANCNNIQSETTDSARLSGQPALAPPSFRLRVKTIQWDSVLRQSWTTFEDCDHPERPAFARQTRVDPLSFRQPNLVAKEDAGAPPPVIHAGDFVRLWRQDDHLRIEVVAVSEESGGLGSSIHVRVLGNGTQQSEQQMIGVVRGPADVEMRRLWR